MVSTPVPYAASSARTPDTAPWRLISPAMTKRKHICAPCRRFFGARLVLEPLSRLRASMFETGVS